jgi:hypothetical protein
MHTIKGLLSEKPNAEAETPKAPKKEVNSGSIVTTALPAPEMEVAA